ncbi:MAG: 2-hydroxyacid dehydrogenase [Clostridiales bacterium]|jgi:D-lactate dehydrogenase|nr:2-hydroxyacid dehydrogenase [Clostridiales bacterium]
MKDIAFYDVKPYDKMYFDALSPLYGFNLRCFESKLHEHSAVLSQGCDGVIAFVNDSADRKTIEKLHSFGIKVMALRSAGYNNVDLKAAFGKIHILRVPAYSPYAVGEHTAALLLALNRKIHRAYNRTREHNFALSGLTGFDLYGKTVGVIGTGRIGRVFIDICKGFGMKVLSYDLFPDENAGIDYVSLSELYKRSDIISLHCPLTKDTKHIINEHALSLMKDGVYILNTSRGALIDTEALLTAIKNKKVGAVGLDVYEEEEDFFFEDFSGEILEDDTLLRLLSMPNVLVTGHQAFLTKEALENIAKETLQNLKDFFDGKPLKNEVCYRCEKYGTCIQNHEQRCF